MPKRIVKFVLPALIAFGCSSADAQKSAKAAIPVDKLPKPVLVAAKSAVENLQITKARQRHKREQVIYKLDGLVGDKAYELKISADGKVLDLEEEPGHRSDSKQAVQNAVATPFQLAATITHAAIRESSGIVASRRFPGVFWTHNDRGNSPSIYAIDRDGKLLAEFAVAAVNDDWEDIALDDQGHLYIGKIGNNKARKDHIEVLRIAEPDPSQPLKDHQPLEVERAYSLSFTDEPFDCEALFVLDDYGYVISKQLNGATAGLYRFPLERGESLRLEKVADLPIRGPVTSADLSPDHRQLAILTYGQLYTFQIDGDVSRIASAKPQSITAPAGKTEGICFTKDGLLITAESRQIYVLNETRELHSRSK